MKATLQARLRRLADSCANLARGLATRQYPMNRLSRSVVFHDNGACGCAFGHALVDAGIHGALHPYFTRGTAGGKEPRWKLNVEAFTAATGVTPSYQLAECLEEAEVANDYYRAEERRTKLVAGLNRLAEALRVEAA